MYDEVSNGENDDHGSGGHGYRDNYTNDADDTCIIDVRNQGTETKKDADDKDNPFGYCVCVVVNAIDADVVIIFEVNVWVLLDDEEKDKEDYINNDNDADDGGDDDDDYRGDRIDVNHDDDDNDDVDARAVAAASCY
jgi:hypothetical protein